MQITAAAAAAADDDDDDDDDDVHQNYLISETVLNYCAFSEGRAI